MNHALIRFQAASLALGVAFLLTVVKLGVGAWSGSVGVFSEGIHSSLDLLSAAIAFFTIREAGKPADLEHPFGHGKIETLSSLFEALLLVVASGFIVYEAIEHIRNPQPLVHAEWAIGTIIFSLIASYWVYRHNDRAARQTESSAIRVNALHFLADAVTSAGVLVGLLVIHFTGWTWVDPVIAFGIALYIVAASWRQIRGALDELTDTRLPDSEVQAILRAADEFRPQALEVHELRTRRSGATRYANFHLVVCGKMSVDESHELCDGMEEKISSLFPAVQVNIHVEPCRHPGLEKPAHCSRSSDGLCAYRNANQGS